MKKDDLEYQRVVFSFAPRPAWMLCTDPQQVTSRLPVRHRIRGFGLDVTASDLFLCNKRAGGFLFYSGASVKVVINAS